VIQITVDGFVWGFQKYGGINTYFNQVLPRVAAFPDTQVDVFVPRGAVGVLPAPPCRILWRDFRASRSRGWPGTKLRRRVIRKINALPLTAGALFRRKGIFHSSYYTRVLGGHVHVASAYDMNHEIFPQDYQTQWGRWLRKTYRRYLTRADRIIAISQKTKDDITRFYQIESSRIDVVHLATNHQVFFAEKKGDGDSDLEQVLECSPVRPYFLFVGMRQMYKNFERLTRAYAASTLKADVDLVVAGHAWSEPEQQLIQGLGIQSNVRLVVQPTDTTLRKLYSHALAFVFPSIHEGFGIPLLEAMACGAMVLAADTEVFREVIGNAALYFDPYSEAEIRIALESALDSDLRQRHSAMGLTQVGKYSWDRCAQQTFEIYRSALNSA